MRHRRSFPAGPILLVGLAAFSAPRSSAQGLLAALGGDRPLLEIVVQPKGGAPSRLFFGREPGGGLSAVALPTEGREGLLTVLGLRGAVPAGSGELGVVAFVHVYEGGHAFLEGQILNDSIPHPAGRVKIDYRVSFLGEAAAEGSADLADETGVGFSAGKPRFAPRKDVVDELLSRLPPRRSIVGVSAAQLRPGGDPDPVENTHRAGSPRNGWIAADAARYLLLRNEGSLQRLEAYVLSQSRRPYHLSEADGSPFSQTRHPRARFIEGRPELRPGRDTLGRDRLSPAALDTGRINGWDHEHMDVEELHGAYALFGSRVARRELVLIADEILTTPFLAEEGHHQHSPRAFGWVARMLLRAYQDTGAPRYLDGVRRMMRSLRAHWRREGPYPALLPQPPAADHMKDERFESPYQVAVAASAVALYLRVAGRDPEALDLLLFLGDLLVERGWSPEGGGFYYDYSADSDRRTGDGTRTNGVTLWVISPLVEIAEWAPPGRREKYLEPARRLWRVNAKEPWGRPGHEVFWNWLLPAARRFAAAEGAKGEE